MHAYIHTYIHTYIPTYIHTYIARVHTCRQRIKSHLTLHYIPYHIYPPAPPGCCLCQKGTLGHNGHWDRELWKESLGKTYIRTYIHTYMAQGHKLFKVVPWKPPSALHAAPRCGSRGCPFFAACGLHLPSRSWSPHRPLLRHPRLPWPDVDCGWDKPLSTCHSSHHRSQARWCRCGLSIYLAACAKHRILNRHSMRPHQRKPGTLKTKWGSILQTSPHWANQPLIGSGGGTQPQEWRRPPTTTCQWTSSNPPAPAGCCLCQKGTLGHNGRWDRELWKGKTNIHTYIHT